MLTVTSLVLTLPTLEMFTFLLVVLPGTIAAVLVAVLVSVIDIDASHEDS